jgi:UDP-N-acetylglucosamine 1-carboxyvinyltransferase
MKWIEVKRSEPLAGTVRIPGSKNSSLALLAAACLADEPVRLKGIPNILDFRVIQDMTAEIGARMTREDNGDLVVDPRSIHTGELCTNKTSAYRASYYFVGALLAKHGKVTIGYPGGDDFVSRPIDQHFKALKALGASVTMHEKHYTVEAGKLTGATIAFDMITSGATIHAMLAAVLADGETVLRQAARDPEVVDTAQLLVAMGAKISGAGTDTIRIKGVSQLSGCTYTVIPDRLIAGAFLMSAGMNGGIVKVEDVIPQHLDSCLSKLREIGMQIETTDSSITAYGPDRIRATRVRTGMYPAFATDLQQPLTALLLLAQGRSIVSDKVFPMRFSHVPQLRRLGAEIDVRSGSAFIQGGRPLKGGLVHATDVRAGTCLIMAGLAAEGTTVITGIEHIERGYDNVIGLFRSLGANVTLMEADSLVAGDTAWNEAAR